VFTKGQNPMKLLGEDGEIAAGPAAGPVPPSAPSTSGSGAPTGTSTVSGGTTSSRIASVETGLGAKRQTVRRKRNPNLNFKKFKDPSKEQK
jgi:hypothetical protein